MMTVFEILKNSGVVPGSIAISTTGHDKKRIYIVISVENKIAGLSDGNYRGYGNQKRKRVSHLKLIGILHDTEQKLDYLSRNDDSKEKDKHIRKWIREFITANPKTGEEKL